ncbi:MAG TPA: hypothetical protein VJ547_01930 [Candidatus Thermoplasmatota archaeon]|nr:hypothetical protein [Candidatus Thermoplasmatota archaeon]
MAVFSRTYQAGPRLSSPAYLSRYGPVIKVRIQVPDDAGTLPTNLPDSGTHGRQGLALIDTGAARSAVDAGVIRGMGVVPVDVAMTGTAVGSHLLDVFPATLGFDELGLTLVFDKVLGANIAAQGIIAILGRDVLRRMVLVYDGVSGHVVIAH